MERVLRGSKATIHLSVVQDGALVNADATPKLTLTRDDGTVLVNAQNSTNTGTGRYTYSLAPAETGQLDLLSATWTFKVGGGADQTINTQVEVVGGFLTSVEAIEAALGAANPAQSFSVDAKLTARLLAEWWLEEKCGVAFRPRYAKEQLDGTGTTDLLLGKPKPTAIRSLSISGTALDSSGLAELVLYPEGVLYRPEGFPEGRRNISVAYEHGFLSTPANVDRAAAKLARLFLLNDPSNLDERATSITTDEASYAMVTPGLRGAVTGIPEVNVVMEMYNYRGAG